MPNRHLSSLNNNKGSLVLDKEGILEYQRNRDPFLMIDFAEVVPGICAKGYKRLTEDTWFFKCHFPGDPTMPGTLQIESLIQMCALTVFTLPGNKGKVVYVSSVNNIKLSKKVLPGNRLDIETQLHFWKRGIGKGSGQGFVNDEKVCEAEFNFVMPDILEEFRLPSKT